MVAILSKIEQKRITTSGTLKCSNYQPQNGFPSFVIYWPDTLNLLHFNLPFNDSVEISESTKSLIENVDHMNDDKVRVLLGPSGCGKTRTIYEYLIKKGGFYLTAEKAGNGGFTFLF